uniref:AWS domain-containing protein n=1 Tax=Soboliphyme baturini TaxID=241478 RepID=A0A183IVJ6_9BILA
LTSSHKIADYTVYTVRLVCRSATNGNSIEFGDRAECQCDCSVKPGCSAQVHKSLGFAAGELKERMYDMMRLSYADMAKLKMEKREKMDADQRLSEGRAAAKDSCEGLSASGLNNAKPAIEEEKRSMSRNGQRANREITKNSTAKPNGRYRSEEVVTQQRQQDAVTLS